ncbi:MAG: DUF3786 domain-containing protein [Planctomycetota bacterium]|jgi:hypothetical protein
MQLPKQDHYELARDAALRRLRERIDAERLSLLGARLSEDGSAVVLPSLCWEFEVQLAPFAMYLLPEREDVSVTWQILALDYLGAENPAPPRRFVSFADFAEGRGYLPAFDSRVNRRLSHTVGRERESFIKAAERLGTAVGEGDPMRGMFRFFPLVEFQVVRYEGDEDFPPACKVLFSDNLLSIFSMEDGIVAAERLASALEGKTPAAAAGG